MSLVEISDAVQVVAVAIQQIADGHPIEHPLAGVPDHVRRISAEVDPHVGNIVVTVELVTACPFAACTLTDPASILVVELRDADYPDDWELAAAMHSLLLGHLFVMLRRS